MRHNPCLAATHLRPSTLPTSEITAVHHHPIRPGLPTPTTEPCSYHLRYGDKAKKCLEGCQYKPKKLIRRPRLTTAATTYDRGLGFYTTDQRTGMCYLIDTGAFCSVYPASRHDINTIDVDPLQLTAANGSNIISHGTKDINLHLDNRNYTLKFLSHHHLLLDIAKRRLLVTYSFRATPLGNPITVCSIESVPCQHLISDYADVSNQNFDNTRVY